MKIDDLVDKAAEYNMKAIALTDNCNLFGAMEFTKKALEKKIQPILGSEILVEYNFGYRNSKKVYSITCLITDQKGWRNLSFLVSKAYKNLQEYKYKFIDFKSFEQNNEGLIILFNDLKDNNISRNHSIDFSFIEKLKHVLKDRLYLNLFRIKKDKQSIKEINTLMLSDELDIPLACSNDVSFLSTQMYEAQDCLMCIGQSTIITDPKRKKPIAECYFKTSEEMINLFKTLPTSLMTALA